MKQRKDNKKKKETIKSKSLETGDKKLNGPNRPST
ncbi:spore protein [Virgibacillus indicus]|uniref:Spore protein n=1 Tax=Virgibacillus indicus TaxID=2024554 RepID=A0A265NFA9_9BACI|nr:spore protein [Virgibacillus indicus]OZU90144.1 spore protein [Virgibacillus indicus]